MTTKAQEIRKQVGNLQDNARDIAELLDDLISEIICRHEAIDPQDIRGRNDNIEVIKRRITDYLLVTDPRSGIYAKGKND